MSLPHTVRLLRCSEVPCRLPVPVRQCFINSTTIGTVRLSLDQPGDLPALVPKDLGSLGMHGPTSYRETQPLGLITYKRPVAKIEQLKTKAP